MNTRYSGKRAALVALVLAWSLGGQASGQDPRDGIVPVGVTASSTQTEAKSPQKLADGWGLSEPSAGGLRCHTGNAFRYQGVERGSMWSSGDVDGRRDLTPTLTFDLGKPRQVGSVRIWNYNEANWTSTGLKEVEFSYSRDGQNFSPLSGAESIFTVGDSPEPVRQITVEQPEQFPMLQHLLGLAAAVDDGIADDLVVEPPVAQRYSIRNRIAEHAVRGALQHVEYAPGALASNISICASKAFQSNCSGPVQTSPNKE